VTVTWSKVSGPGTVTFGNANAVDTTATFSMDGAYVLQLLADDSALQSTDTVTITVNPQAGGTTFRNGLDGYTGCTDSYMEAGNPTANFNGLTRMRVTGYADQGATNVQRPIVKFDLSSIPTSTTISSATLYLYAYDEAGLRGSTGYYGVYRLTQAWADTQVTWNNATSSITWTTPGGDIEASPDATSPKQAVAGVWYPFDVTSRVQNWIATPANNMGWVVRCTDENLHNQDLFYQSEAADTDHRPTLVVVMQQAAPTFVAAGTVASGTGAITPALPAGVQANDILLLFLETANQAISISNQNGGTWTQVTGSISNQNGGTWTQVTGSPQGTGTAGGTAATRLTVFWSRYNGTQGAPTVSDSGNHQLGRMIAIRGATTSGDPWDVTAGGVEAASDTSGSIPGATTTVANDLVVVAIATSLPDADSTAKFSGWTNANLSGLTERTDNTVKAGNGGGLAIATGGKATAGAYGATTVTLVNAAAKGMMSIAIKP